MDEYDVNRICDAPSHTYSFLNTVYEAYVEGIIDGADFLYHMLRVHEKFDTWTDCVLFIVSMGNIWT